jgi:uncharacterized delta-60 repeat protein
MIASNGKFISANSRLFKQGVYFDYGFDAETYASYIQPDGKILVIGAFNFYNSIPYKGIIRLNSDGTIDESFNYGQIGIDDFAYCITLQADGKILVGGSFQNYNGNPCGNVIRLNPDGIRDLTFTVYSGVFTTVTIAYLPSGKILVAGDMGTPEMYRLNSDGSLDSTFNVGGSGFDNYINSMIIQQDEKIVVAGGFNNYNGIAANYIVRLNADGSIDSTFSSGDGFDQQVWSVAVQSDGKLIVSGDFENYNDNPCNNILRLNSDGSLDTSFTADFNSTPYIIIIQYDGKIVVGGNFIEKDGTPCGHIARLNSDGSLDSKFNIGSGFDDLVQNIEAQFYNGKYIITGYFRTFNGNTANRIARINLDGTLDK